MKHKTWGEMVQSRNPETRDLHLSGRGIEEEEENCPEHQNDARDDRNSILYTRFLYAAFFVCGMVIAQRGPSILDLGAMTESTLRSSVSLFAFGAVGQMVGGVMAGLLLGRLDTSALLFWFLLAMGCSTLALPWCQTYGILAAVYCLSLLCMGCVETGSYAEIAQRWKSKGSAVVEKLQLWFVIGAMISPGMTQFFLDPRYRHPPTSQDNVTSVYNETTQWATDVTTRDSTQWATDVTTSDGYLGTEGVNTVEPTSNSGNESHTRAVAGSNSNVYIAYIISGALTVLASLLFLVIFFRIKQHQPLEEQPARPQKVRHTLALGHLRFGDFSMLVLLLVALFVFLVTAVEESLHQFLFTFLIHKAHWTAHAAGWLTSWLWAGILLVRIVTYLAPNQLADEMILTLSCVVLPCTLAGLHVSVELSSNDGVWACTFFVGMSVSVILPVSFTWMHTSLAQWSPLVSCVVMSSSMVASIINPLVLGQFLSEERHEGFTLLLMAQAALALAVFLLLHVLSRRLLTRCHQTSAKRSSYVGYTRGDRGRSRLEEEGELQNSDGV